MTLGQKFALLEKFHPEWEKRVKSHDKHQDQGARRINRSDTKRHVAYGDNTWQKDVVQPASKSGIHKRSVH